MAKRFNQGSRLVATLLGLVGISVISGLWLGLGVDDTRKNQLEVIRKESIQAQAELLTQGLKNDLTQIRQIGQKQLQIWAKKVPSPTHFKKENGILHWAVIEVKDKKPTQVVKTPPHSSWGPFGSIPQQKKFERIYFEKLIKEIDPVATRKKGMTAIRIQPEKNSRRSWIALVFPTSRSYVYVGLIKPMEALTTFKSFATENKKGKKRLFMMDNDGLVLAHSRPSYIGADFAQTEIFKEGIAQLKQQTGIVSGQFKTIDKFMVTAAALPLKNLPFHVVVEDTLPLSSFGSDISVFDTWIKTLGQIVLLIGFLTLAVVLVSWQIRRRIIQAAERTGTVTKNQRSVVEKVDTQNMGSGAQLAGMPLIPGQLKEQSPQTNNDPTTKIDSNIINAGAPTDSADLDSINNIKDALQLVADFDAKAKITRDPAEVGLELTQSASKLCDSQTLLFVYHHQIRTAILQADGGFSAGDAPVSMSFPVDQYALKRIVQCAKEKKIASLAKYEPLSSQILSHLGIAHFEAWGITGGRDPNDATRDPKLVGILVILQSGVQSNTHRESLLKMMKTTSVAYEDTFFRY